MQEWSTRAKERPRIPILRGIDAEGTERVFTESNEINRMLNALDGKPTYTPNVESIEYVKMIDWFTWCDTIFKQQVDLFKYGKNLVMDADMHSTHVHGLRTMVQKIEDELPSGYLLGEKLSLADIAIIPFVRQIMRTRGGEFDFTDFPKVAQWTQTITETDWFKNDVMKKYPLAPMGL